jgi:hypothetical protein
LSAVLTEGRYTLVFEITGAETVLSRTEKPFYYIARKTFTFNGIRSFVSSGEPNTTIVAPGEHILFEANLVCDKSFHPYIIWRDNNKEIAAGYLDADKYSLLWEAPAKNGFKNISAEIFPVKPRPEDIAMRGVTANISIAVSEKAKTGAFLAANMDNFNAWFRLAGSLKDEKNKSRALVSPEGTEVIWRGVSSTYGLLIDSRRNYALPDTTLKILKGYTAAEKLLFAVHPKSSGLFYSADIKDGNKPYYSVKLSVTADGFSLSVVPAYDAELAEKVFVPRNPAEPIHAVSFEYTLDEKGIVFTLENEGKTGTAAFDFVHLDAEKKKDARLPAVWPSAYSVKQRFGGALNGEQTASGILTELAIQSGTKTGEADVAANAKNGASSSSQ